MKPRGSNLFGQSMASPAARNYLFLAGACVVLNFALMAGNGSSFIVVLATMLAVAGLFLRWTLTPFLYLVLVSYDLFDPGLSGLFRNFGQLRLRRSAMPGIEDALTAFGAIGYMLSCFRLLSFWQAAAPSRFRNRGNSVGRAEGRLSRPFENAPESESHGFAVQALACMATGLTAILLLNRLGIRLSSGNKPPLERHLASFALFVAVVLGSLVLSQLVWLLLERRGQSREKAYLVLADTLWKETRREQQRIDRWAGWRADRDRKRGVNRP